MHMFLYFIMFLCAMVLMAHSETMDHNDNTIHWYDEECCNLKDCEPVPVDAEWVTVTDDGYRVIISSYEVNELIPFDSPKIRESKDNRFHVCWNRAFEYDYSAVNHNVICLYVPGGMS